MGVEPNAPPSADRPRVSVIVPVYDAGPYLQRCVDSLLAQTLPPGQVELIFVDDGSTDGSGERLDALAAAHAHVTVIHQENSGWPGKPRNVGMDAARGEYLFFADADDKVGPEALERLEAIARRDEVDIVLGRIIGHHRPIAARDLFVADRSRIRLEDAPFMDSLTVQKLFRAEFLERHGLRFPEGRRRLEDLAFVLRAYFMVDRMSILASYDCYFAYWRDDGANIAAQPVDPAHYYAYLREIIGIVEANTTPGPERDRLVGRFARDQLAGRLKGNKGFLERPASYRRSLLDSVREVVEAQIPPTVDPLLPPTNRVRMALVRADRLDLLESMARADIGVHADCRVVTVRKDPAGTIVIHLDAGLVRDGAPLLVVDRAGTILLDTPDDVAQAVSDDARALPAGPPGTVALILRRRDDSGEARVSTTVDVRTEPGGPDRVAYRYEVRGEIDLTTIAAGRPLRDGRWHVIVRVEQAGYAHECRVPSPTPVKPDARAFEVDGAATTTIGVWAGEKRHLALEVRPLVDRRWPARLGRTLRRVARRVGIRRSSPGRT